MGLEMFKAGGDEAQKTCRERCVPERRPGGSGPPGVISDHGSVDVQVSVSVLLPVAGRFRLLSEARCVFAL
ncbi:hypothetical protein AMECASPLE_035097 [Ameca splendens]|uniref:Uncharacterized protein n=1 Tax=Ameca splendens TaxID=208324 RepID=A0ABV0ZU81_9TELE